jgi:hypothetical protein
LIIVPFIPSHLTELVLHEYVDFVQSNLSDPAYGAALDNGMSWTAINDNGDVMCCSGLVPVGLHRAEAWALMSKQGGRSLIGVVRAIGRELDNNKFKRVQAGVRVDFVQGAKMMELLGFVNETPNGMTNYGDDGYDYYLYARCA